MLWHFSGYNKPPEKAFEILNSILESKTLRIGTNGESVLMPTGQRRYGYRVSCMCDIPFRDLRIHTLRYGQFGVSFYKRDAISKGNFNPVFYVHRDNRLFHEATELLNTIENQARPDESLMKNLSHYLLTIGAYVKRGDLTRIVELDCETDSIQENNFYYEREWRTLAPWNFEDSAVAALMMPTAFLKRFQDRWGPRFVNTSIISSEMIETL